MTGALLYPNSTIKTETDDGVSPSLTFALILPHLMG